MTDSECAAAGRAAMKDDRVRRRWRRNHLAAMRSPKVRANCRAASNDPKLKAQRAEKFKKTIRNPEVNRRWKKSLRAANLRPDVKRRRAVSIAKANERPEVRKNRSDGAKRRWAKWREANAKRKEEGK